MIVRQYHKKDGRQDEHPKLVDYLEILEGRNYLRISIIVKKVRIIQVIAAKERYGNSNPNS